MSRSIPVGGEAINVVLTFFTALLSFRGISTPSLPAQGEQRRSSYFNIPRGNSHYIATIKMDIVSSRLFIQLGARMRGKSG
jgi:hypothetical protein